MLISEEADGDSSSEEDQEIVDHRNEQYIQDVDTEAPQQAPKEAPQQAPEEAPQQTPEEAPEQSGAPAEDHIDIPLTEEEITIFTSGEEEEQDQPIDQPSPVEVISIDLNEENAPVSCKWGSFLPSNYTFIY